MIFGMMKSMRDKRTMHEVIAEDYDERIKRVTGKALRLADKLNNGGGLAILAQVDAMVLVKQ